MIVSPAQQAMRSEEYNTYSGLITVELCFDHELIAVFILNWHVQLLVSVTIGVDDQFSSLV